jgi:L-alanine-DL-glutamate epimerase-like enolase superfamily enzyme
MKITRIDSFLLRIPVGRAMTDSLRSVSALEFAGVEIVTEAGLTGTGYTVTVGHGGSVIREVIDTLFADDLIGSDPHEVRAIWTRLDRGKARWIGRAGATTMAQAAIDIALWDLIAKDAERPLWQILGASHAGGFPIYNTYAGWLNLTIDELTREAGDLVEQGYRAIKMKVGSARLATDVERVAAMRAALPADVLLMVDANQTWDASAAARACAQLEQFDLGWVEEPLHPDDIRAHRDLRARTSIPIALGEHVYTTHAFRDYLEADAVDIVQVDVCRVGGITPWLEVAALAHAFDKRVCPHAGDLMQVHQHLVRSIPNSWMLEVIPIWEQGPFVHQIELEQGHALAPTAPGVSTDFTRAALEKYHVD